MVDLPTIANGVPSVHAPQSRVSSGDVAQPYNELAANLDRAGETLSKDVAVPLAQRAGLQAVSRDDQGNLQVERLPIVGDAATAYSRAVQFSALAQGEAEARRADLKLARQFQNDPEGYRKAAEAFKQKYVAEYTKSIGPAVGISLGRSIDATTTQQYSGLLAQQQATIKRNFDHDTRASIADAETDLTNLIEAGGANTPEARRLIDKVITLQHERVNNPVLAAPRAETEIELKKFDERVGAAQFAYGIKQTLKNEGNVDKAMAQIDAMANDKSLSPTQRAVNQASGLVAIKEYTQESARQINIAKQVRQQRDELSEDAIIKDSASDNPTITENDIKKSDMSPAAKIRMLSWIKRDGVPEPLAHVSEHTTQEVFRRMNLPEGDPKKITSVDQIRDLYAPPDGGRGVLKRTDEQWLEKVFTEARSPEGGQLSNARKEFFKNYQAAIDPTLGGDPAGGQKMYFALTDAKRQEDVLRAQGKDPHLVYDPRSEYFFGNPKNLQKYQRPLDEQLKQYQQQATQPTASTTPAFTPPRTWEWSPSRRQYRDPATGKIYDASGKEAIAGPVVPRSF